MVDPQIRPMLAKNSECIVNKISSFLPDELYAAYLMFNVFHSCLDNHIKELASLETDFDSFLKILYWVSTVYGICFGKPYTSIYTLDRNNRVAHSCGVNR